jgi:hypothetical protein
MVETGRTHFAGRVLPHGGSFSMRVSDAALSQTGWSVASPKTMDAPVAFVG